MNVFRVCRSHGMESQESLFVTDVTRITPIGLETRVVNHSHPFQFLCHFQVGSSARGGTKGNWIRESVLREKVEVGRTEGWSR